MAGPRRSEILRHSVIDRLAGGRGDSPRGGDLRIGVEDLRQVVRRDLEWLLNTRLVAQEVLRYPEAKKSILAYGLPDLSTFSVGGALSIREICELIANAVKTFEPRLQKRSIKVEFIPSKDISDFTMRFRISGVIQVEPIREPVTFDTSLDPSSGVVTVEETY
jgi:type VI secretion system protein ImpF